MSVEGIEALAAFAAAANEERDSFLEAFAPALRSVLSSSAVLVLAQGRRGGFKPLALACDTRETGDPRFWSPDVDALEAALASGQAERADVLVGGRHQARVLLPYRFEGEESLCLVAYFAAERIAQIELSTEILRFATLAIERRDRTAAQRQEAEAFELSTLLLDMFSKTADAETFKRSLYGLVLELEKFFGCQRVAIGTGSRRSCQVHAVSGMSGEEKRSLGLSQLALAMREAIALGETVVWPGQGDLGKGAVVSANHDDLLHSFKSGRLLVVPVGCESMGTSGALALLWPTSAPEIDQRSIRLLAACRPHLGALVGFVEKSKPGHIKAEVLRHWRSGPVKRVAAVAALVGVVAALLFPIRYRVPAECRVEPVMRRTVAAPFESRLMRSYVRPGDAVTEGQALAELDGREIRVSLAESIAARSAALKRRDHAMATSDAAAFQLAQLEADRLTLEVERLQFRNDHLVIRSPLDGVVLTGDLERSEGVPVPSGQKLFEIAPMEEMVLEIAVPDSAVRHVGKGMSVTARLESDSGRKREAEILDLHPVSEVRDGENVFIAEALLDNEDGNIRPGMKGRARVLTARKPLGWILFHGLWDFLRLKLW